eukprot:PLAT3638.5.p2 GENE.PLAT3638.5~~PLAT3638.5.p2  ORF type:complete len:383 (+),score=218.35 PLAT3638.5:361-1509(+)
MADDSLAAAFDLASYVAKLQAGGDEPDAETLAQLSEPIDGGDLSAFVLALLEHTELLLSVEKDADVEGCFAMLATVLRGAGEEEMTKLAAAVAEKLTAVTEKRAALRLNCLGMLYNGMVGLPAQQYGVIVHMAEYAAAAHLGRELLPYTAAVDASLVRWGSSVDEQRALFLALRSAFTGTVDSSALHYLVRYLSTYEAADAAALAAQAELASEAVVLALKHSILTAEDALLELAPVRALKEGEYATLYKLLHIFSVERLPALTAFQAAHPDFFASIGLDDADALRKMRLLTLCSMAGEERELSYAAIAEALDIDVDAVESWVFDCIAADLLVAKMDQLNSRLIVTRATQRVFALDHWKQLQTQLHAWKDSVGAMLERIRSSA